MNVLDEVEKQYMRKEPLRFEVGDTVDVHVRIREGDNERVQVFSGVVIAIKGGGTRKHYCTEPSWSDVCFGRWG